MIALLWTFRRGQPSKLNRGFRWAQTASAAAMSVGHGMQDAAKTMGIIVLALYTGGFADDKTHIPEWVFWTSAAMLAAGTYAGGWRIIRTLGRKIIDLRPPEASPPRPWPAASSTSTRWSCTPHLHHPHHHQRDHGRRRDKNASPPSAGT